MRVNVRCVSVFIVLRIVWGRGDRTVLALLVENSFNAINMDNDNNER